MVFYRPNSVSVIIKVGNGMERREDGFERYLGGPGDSCQVTSLMGDGHSQRLGEQTECAMGTRNKFCFEHGEFQKS